MKHHHLRRIVLRTVWPVSVRSTPLFFGSVVAHLDEDDSINELFRLNPVLSHRHLDFTKQLQCCVSLENLSTRTRLILCRYNPIHDIQWDLVNHSIFSFQASYWSWIFIVSAKTKYRLRENVYLCFRQLDGSVVQQSSSHPWNRIPISCRYHPKYFFTLIQDQSQWKFTQLFDIFDVRILGGTQIFLIILSKMYRCFRCCGHKYSPDRRVDVDVKHVVSLRTTQFPSYKWTDFLMMANVVPGYLKVVVR